MALAAVQSAMHTEKKIVHPFFSKPLRNSSPERTLPSDDTSAQPSHDDPDDGQLGAQASKPRKKRARKSDGSKDKNEIGPGQKTQAPLTKFTRPLDVRNGGGGGPSLDEDPNHDRRKRRKTASPTPIPNRPHESKPRTQTNNFDLLAQLQTEAEQDAARVSMASGDLVLDDASAEKTNTKFLHQSGPGSENSATEEATSTTERVEASEPKSKCTEVPLDEPKKATPKKKILKVNRNGKLMSPISTKQEAEVAPSPKRRRRRATSKFKTPPTATTIKYGSDVKSRRALGQKIDAILNGESKSVTQLRPPPKAPTKRTEPSKAPHPFFLGKATQKKDEPPPTKPPVDTQAPPSPRASRRSAVTPGKLRAESRMHQSSQPLPAFGPMGANSRAKNQLGLHEPSWPTKDNAHVRNLESFQLLSKSRLTTSESHSLRTRKLKNNIITVPHDEDLISRLSQQLKTAIRKQSQVDDTCFEPPEDVRLPTRLLTTGVNIQERVRREIRAPLPRSGEQSARSTDAHPAVAALFRDVEHALTPFDRGTCESQSWVSKYAPTCASHVLQSGKEATVLRDWLQGLTVKSVVNNPTTVATISETKKPLKKKRKKEVDDFIVFSDEEEGGNMEDCSDSEMYGRSEVLPRQKSVKRPRVSRHKNVIVISGPHGCGKSATVYAVAKELGFEVFEINSSSRRSGKDVQDKVGDMSENHLVSNKRNEVTAKPDAVPADDTDNERMDEALRKDLDSGRQGTMTSFFTSKALPNLKLKVKAKVKELQEAPTSAQATLSIPQAPQKLQKQSLILFEEADVLFEEDQQFWAQVTRLASQSKRPVVVTCNDEALIPVYELPLAAILRLSPPPLDLAADYLLALAAKEGHILDRKAICDLLRVKNFDLRASITELDFWCQMSVGDRKGGLEWIYQRWPLGKDVDEHGRCLRVASQGTYHSGMGWLSHNISASTGNIGFDKDAELLKETWTDWGVNPRDCNTANTPTDLSTAQNSSEVGLRALERLDRMHESMSAADIYCRVGLPSYEDHSQEPPDPSLPPIIEKDKSSYTLVAPVIQVDHVSDFNTFDTDMLIQTHLRIQRAFGSLEVMPNHATLNPDGLVQKILQHKHNALNRHALSWPDFSEAFDILAYPPSTILEPSKSHQLTASSFDRTFRIVTEDLAPYVRSIVAYERLQEAQRLRLSNLLSEGGTRKRPRTTRASRVAMEGGRRETKRRERYFDELNFSLVMATAGGSWAGIGSLVEEEDESRSRGTSVSTQQEKETGNSGSQI